MIQVYCQVCDKDLGEVVEKPNKSVCWDCYYGKNKRVELDVKMWEEKIYGGYDGKLRFRSNCPEGWEKGKELGGEYKGLSMYYQHIDGDCGATELSFEEAKDLRDSLSQYIDLMEK